MRFADLRNLLLLVLVLAHAGTLIHAQDKPLPPAEAARQTRLPQGFQITLCTAEPEIVQPIAMALDDRGRLWVVECTSYPDWKTEGTGHDRVLIFEDKNGDGVFDSRKVFLDHGTNLSGIEVGFGGVWLCATPNFLFIPDNDGDDVPDGPESVLLDGWDLKAKHNVSNGLTWGPDGWLYGCNGILSKSSIGKPGTPEEKRVAMDCGVWRYHPVRHEFEVVASGTTNPWGLDFDQYGQMFITNCVIAHLFHVIPGAHFKRMFGQDLNPYVYELMEGCADHIHWGGGKWSDSAGGQGIHDKPGGGHAHAGAMIYLGDNWPQKYREGIFTCNIHGRRVNQDVLKRQGSGVVAQHASDFLYSRDPWFRGLEMKYGPDGGVYMTDWNDTGECHDYKDPHRETGRIFKITYGAVSSRLPDLASLDDRELVALQQHQNHWYVVHSRRLLQERAAAGNLDQSVVDQVRADFAKADDERVALRLLWTLHAMGGSKAGDATGLDSPHAFVRGWAVQLELEGRTASNATLDKLAQLAASDPSPVVRLYLASALQRLPLESRWRIAEALVAQAKDAGDANLPLMIWYGVEPLVAADKTRAISLIAKTKIPLVRQLIARRLAEQAK